ncbi:MAG: hypothetical protein OXI15_16625 [Chromatiales bacterium]|nr:hypothetical protein [Chromatiales bacterium]
MKTKNRRLWVRASLFSLLLSLLHGVTAYANERSSTGVFRPTGLFPGGDSYRDVADFEMWECKVERGTVDLVLAVMNAKGVDSRDNTIAGLRGIHKRGFIFDIQFGVRLLETGFYAQRYVKMKNGKKLGEFTIRRWTIKRLYGSEDFTIEEQPRKNPNSASYKGSYRSHSDFEYPDYACTIVSEHKVAPDMLFGDPEHTVADPEHTVAPDMSFGTP